MANTILTNKNAPGVVAKLAAGRLADKAIFAKTVDKEDSSVFGKQFEGAQPGDTIFVKKPARFEVGSNLDITSSIQGYVEEKVALPLDKVSTIAVEFSSLEVAYEKGLKYMNESVIQPAMDAMAADIDSWLLNKAVLATNQLVGTSGTDPAAVLTYLQANQKLTEHLAPMDDQRYAILNPTAMTATSDARKGIFNPDPEISKIYKMGYLGQGQGMTYLQSNLLPSLTNGTAVAAATVTSTMTNGTTTLLVTGTGTETITAGTVLTVSGVYDVHPLTKATLPNLKQFVVTTNATAIAGAYTLTVNVDGGAVYNSTGESLQNVSAMPQGSATVTMFGAGTTLPHGQSLAFHKSAVRLCTVPLHLPTNEEFAARETVDGISVSIIRAFDPLKRREILRFDVLAGAVAVRPEWMCRISN